MISLRIQAYKMMSCQKILALLFFLLTLKFCYSQKVISSQCVNSSAFFIPSAVSNSKFVFLAKIISLAPISSKIPSSQLIGSNISQWDESSIYTYKLRRRRMSKDFLWRALVKIKTFFKGAEESQVRLGDEIELLVREEDEKCFRRLRKYDTRIFFYEEIDKIEEEQQIVFDSRGKNWTQVLLPLPPSLTILTSVRKAAQDEPCESIKCPFGGVCTVENGRGICRCVQNCKLSKNKTVCGTDGVSYENECLLRKKACEEGQTQLAVKHFSKCPTEDPCERLNCLYGSFCVSSDDGTTATCECPSGQNCKNYEKHGGGYICGSDVQNGLKNVCLTSTCTLDLRKDYKNICEFEEYACKSQLNLTIKYHGKCNPCLDYKCEWGICALDIDRSAKCICADFKCPLKFEPVCGSDGNSYSSECSMKEEACRTGRELSIIYTGFCFAETKLDEMSSNGLNEDGTVDTSGILECSICYTAFGSSSIYQCINGHVMCGKCTTMTQIKYNNVCQTCKIQIPKHEKIRNTALEYVSGTLSELKMINADEMSSGSSDEQRINPCDSLSCNKHETCSINNFGIPECTCAMNCSTIYKPVCGTDGKTYDSECHLERISCLEISGITMKYNSSCQVDNVCETKFCSHGSFCSSDNNDEGTCVCPNCPSKNVYSLICGSNGASYPNECSMKYDACITGTDIFIANKGPCDKCKEMNCEFYSTCEGGLFENPKCICPKNCSQEQWDSGVVCGSNGISYNSECDLRISSCLQQKHVTVVSFGHCDLCEDVQCKFGAKCDGGSCLCPIECPSTLEAICASNYKTYTNECEMEKEGCLLKEDLKINYYGPCEKELKISHSSSQNRLNCSCNKLGTRVDSCRNFGFCDCKSGVGGEKCDRCLPGFWGLNKIRPHDDGGGCQKCACSKFGSVREDCEQMTGSCVCKPGVIGLKCDSCLEKDEALGPYGCTSDLINFGESCRDLDCSFGAECEEDGNDRAGCVCNIQCEDEETNEKNSFNAKEVCGTDEFTYQSECELSLHSCRTQKGIEMKHRGSCSNLNFEPAHQSHSHGREIGYLEKNSNSETIVPYHGIKSPRHLPPDSMVEKSTAFFSHSHHNQISNTFQIKSFLGDSCFSSSECITTFSICHNSKCVCKNGYFEDVEGVKCQLLHNYEESYSEVCTKSLCHPTATCFDFHNGSYSCICPIGTQKTEDGCFEQELPLPFFSGKSHVSIGKIGGHHKLSIELDLTPLFNYAHGTIIFSSQFPNGTGDFVALTLIDGYVEFRYELGDGPTTLRSASRLHQNIMYKIVGERYNRDAYLRINNEEEVRGSSAGKKRTLNLDIGGFIGHVPIDSTVVWETVGTSQGFIGCINKLKIGRRLVEFRLDHDPLLKSFHQLAQCTFQTHDTLTPETRINFASFSQDGGEEKYLKMEELNYYPVSKIGDSNSYQTGLEKENSNLYPSSKIENSHFYTTLEKETLDEKIQDPHFYPVMPLGDPCVSSPCSNNGICLSDEAVLARFKCLCHPDYTGVNCEEKMRESTKRESNFVINMNGFSYLELPRISDGARNISIEIWFLTTSPNGLILYSGQESGRGDFIALSLKNGHLSFCFELGSGIANLTWPRVLSLNQWHRVSADRLSRSGYLQVDGEMPISAKSPPALSELSLHLPLYIGNIPDHRLFTRHFENSHPFRGAFQKIVVNGQNYEAQIQEALKEGIVEEYGGGPCEMHTCSNGGTCYPRLSSFACACTPKFSGNSCQIRKEVPGPIRFNGENYIKFPQKAPKRNKIQKRNKIEIFFRTQSEEDSVILWTGKNSEDSILGNNGAKKGYIGIFIKGGYPELRIDLAPRKHKKPIILTSKTKVSDGKWHQILVVRRRRLIVFQIDSSAPQRATSPIGSNVLISDGRFWIGGVERSILPPEIPRSYEKGFIGCIDSVRVEKKRLPLLKIAHGTGMHFCDDEL